MSISSNATIIRYVYEIVADLHSLCRKKFFSYENLHETYKPIKKENSSYELSPQNTRKERTINYDIFTKIFKEEQNGGKFLMCFTCTRRFSSGKLHNTVKWREMKMFVVVISSFSWFFSRGFISKGFSIFICKWEFSFFEKNVKDWSM